MKKNILSVTAVAFLLLMAACGGGDSPKAVAEKFLKALNAYDFEGAKQYGTVDTGKLMDMMSGFAKMMPDSSRNTEIKFEITGEKIDADKAIVTYKEEGKEGEIPLSLVRVEGKWKVNMTKESLNDAEGGNTMDVGATNTDTTSIETPSPPSSR